MVPDDDPSGLASAVTVSTPVVSVTGLKVSLKLSGTWNGDVFCYLTHSSGYSVLLNRVGRRDANSLGYNDDGIDVTFDDAATNGDIHVYRLTLNGSQSIPISGPLTNVWAPDARVTNPTNVLDTDARSAFLSSFSGLDPNGEWVLFVADMEAGDMYTLDNWGLEITGYTPPVITGQPVSLTNECSAGSATFSVAASGSAPLSYQWRHNGTPILGQAGNTLTITNASIADAGSYDVVVTNNYGIVTSSAAILTVVDTTAPVITLLGASPMTNECHSAFVDPGATASDLCAGSLSVSTNGAVNPDATGVYTITYTATDPSGNTASVSRTVHVVDTTPPSLTLLGASPMTNECHSAFVDPGATASDLCAGSLTVTTNGSVNPDATGVYTITYTATDPSGNTASVSRTVYVVDTTPPVIVCPANMTLSTTNSAGVIVNFSVTATDLCSGSLPVVSAPAPGSVFAIGTTTVNSTAVDASGNVATCSFTITVVSNSPPVAANTAMGAVENHPRKLLLDKLLGNCSDPDGDVLSVSAVSPASTNGGTVTLTATNVIYLPPTNYIGTDLFTYTVSDGRGGYATASVIVQVTSENALSFNRIGSIKVNFSGVTITFAGIPGDTYSVQRTTDMKTWTVIGSFTVPDNGIAQFTDTQPPAGEAFYRTMSE